MLPARGGLVLAVSPTQPHWRMVPCHRRGLPGTFRVQWKHIALTG